MRHGRAGNTSAAMHLAFLVALGLALAFLGGGQAGATESPPDAGQAFEPNPVSTRRYSIVPPQADPERQRLFYESSDGTELHLDAWIPGVGEHGKVPGPVPVILAVSPYHGTLGAYPLMEEIVPRGYAYVQADARGTGGSAGCFDEIGPRSRADLDRTLEFLSGPDRPSWSNGRIATYGISQDGASALLAGTVPNREGPRGLRAIAAIAPNTSAYDQFHQDGVPFLAQRPTASLASYYLLQAIRPNELNSSPSKLPEHTTCIAEESVAQTELDGNLSPWFRDRDIRERIDEFKTPVLLTRGIADNRVPPLAEAGFFDRLPAKTPKVGFFGLFDHELPEDHALSGTPELERADFELVLDAWFDRWLKARRGTRVDQWPTVQIQGTDGQWRAEAGWPNAGKAGQLALGGGGGLGSASPAGSSTFREGLIETTTGGPPQGGFATWETPPLNERLEIQGTAVADLWLSSSTDDGHIAARLEAFGPDGEAIPFGRTFGLRSLQHLEPLEANRFSQTVGKPITPQQVVRVPLRFQPTAMVVPPGGRLRLTVAGSLIVNEGVGELAEFTGLGTTTPSEIEGPSQPSFAFSEIEVFHSCSFPSMLRFHVADRTPDLLNVREPDESSGTSLRSTSSKRVVESDGGLAGNAVCGRRPIQPERALRLG